MLILAVFFFVSRSLLKKDEFCRKFIVRSLERGVNTKHIRDPPFEFFSKNSKKENRNEYEG